MFNFDKVFSPDTSQQDIYEEVQHLVQSFLDGNDVCIFSYGQTGSGKTYTIGGTEFGTSDEPTSGIIPRALSHMDFFLKNARVGQVNVKVMFTEIYQNEVHNLLHKTKKKNVMTQINQSSQTKPTFIEVGTKEQIFQHLKEAESNRFVAKTACNARSSRSHFIFQLQLTMPGQEPKTLSLVDLAGSERLINTKAEDDRLKESNAINDSLSCLANVIRALKEKNPHVPYRNSKLTSFLEKQLGSSSAKILMIVNLSPIPTESLCSLRFACST